MLVLRKGFLSLAKVIFCVCFTMWSKLKIFVKIIRKTVRKNNKIVGNKIYALITTFAGR